MTLAEFQKENAKRLDAEWASRYPNGMGYIIQMKAGGIVYGLLTARPTSATQRSRFRGSTATGYSGWYFGKSFQKGDVTSHKTYSNLAEWKKDLADFGITVGEV